MQRSKEAARHACQISDPTSVPVRIRTEIHDELMRRIREVLEGDEEADWGFY